MLAIIAARGGSKGLPGKNIRALGGKPLIAYTIEAAIHANVFERIIVNTDSHEIAKVAEEYGAEIPFLRPEELASDEASSTDVLKHTIEYFAEQGQFYDSIALLQPTSPLRTETHIKEAFGIFRDRNVDSLISFTKEPHPIFWNKFINEKGLIENVFQDAQMSHGRQSYTPTYVPNGAIYMFKSTVLDQNSLYTENTYGYVMDSRSSIDIDTLEDFEYCEFLLNKNV